MLPDIKPFEEIELAGDTWLMGAAGFENRSIAIFDELSEQNISSIESAIGLRYKPYKTENKVQEFNQGIEQLGIESENYYQLTYDRYNPESFETQFDDRLRESKIDYILLDVSGMSKFAIMLIMNSLADHGVNTTVFYAEAETYEPTKDEFQKRKEKTSEPDETPAFLTQGIYDIAISSSLSSPAKSNQPMVAIAFPGFNHRIMMALANEFSPHMIISINGIPRLEQDEWRKDAVQWINRNVESYLEVMEAEVSTFDYSECLELLEDKYREYATDHRIVLAPTGSKLQTVAASIFQRTHSDIQVVYPVVKDFNPTEYSKGWKDPWGISFGDIDQIASEFSEKDDDRIDRLREKAARINEMKREGELN